MKPFMMIVCALTLGISAGESVAYQVDAAQRALAKEHREQWNIENSAVEEKLSQLKREHGKPNIIMILTDDIGWGELGSYGGGKLRGTPTPNLDTLAADGMKFLQHYSEPSCTPTRAALMTGRLPIRTGLDEVLFPGQVKGLVAEEYTLAELLSDAGYRTAMFGKWHMGEQDQHQPTNQGFDYALYTMFNGGVWPWSENAEYYDPKNETIGEVPYTLDMPKDYEQQTGIIIHGIQESRKGEKPREIGKLTLERYNVHEQELTEGILRFVEDNAKSEKPFFVYWASNANQVFFCPPEERMEKYVDKANCQASQLSQHDKNIKRLRDKLEQLDITRNTLVIWVSDNGPMYQFFPSAGFSYLRGKKHQVYEGGVRTPAIAWWPGVIKAGQDPLDLVHVTDWYTTIAQITGTTKNIPGKRIIDGVDQTSLLFNGEGHSRRNYVFHYEYKFFNKNAGSRLAAVRWNNTKLHIKQPVEIYNIMRDPKEEFSMRPNYLWAVIPMRKMIYEHQNMMKKYPNRKIKETAGSKLAY